MKKELNINDENYSYYVQKIGAKALRKNDKVILTLDDDGILRSWEFLSFVPVKLTKEVPPPPINIFCREVVQRKKYTEGAAAQISDMYDKGYSVALIAKKLQLDSYSLRNYINKFERKELAKGQQLAIKEMFDTYSRKAEQIAVMLKIRLNLVKEERMRIIQAYAKELSISPAQQTVILRSISMNNSAKSMAERTGLKLSIIEAFLNKIK